MSIEVGLNSFWDYNPKTLLMQSKAFKLKQDEIRANLWLQGLYFKMAIVSAFDKDISYPEKPIDLTADNENSETSSTVNQATRFGAIAIQFNQNFVKQHPEAVNNTENP